MSIVVPANSAAITVSMVADSVGSSPMPAFITAEPPSMKAPMPPLPKAEYTACQSASVAKPAVATRMAASASMPSPMAPK